MGCVDLSRRLPFWLVPQRASVADTGAANLEFALPGIPYRPETLLGMQGLGHALEDDLSNVAVRQLDFACPTTESVLILWPVWHAIPALSPCQMVCCLVEELGRSPDFRRDLLASSATKMADGRIAKTESTGRHGRTIVQPRTGNVLRAIESFSKTK